MKSSSSSSAVVLFWVEKTKEVKEDEAASGVLGASWIFKERKAKARGVSVEDLPLPASNKDIRGGVRGGLDRKGRRGENLGDFLPASKSYIESFCGL